MENSVHTLYLSNNQIEKIENIPNSVQELYLEYNPCNISTNDIKWMSNFNKIAKIIENYLILDLIKIIKDFSTYDCF